MNRKNYRKSKKSPYLGNCLYLAALKKFEKENKIKFNYRNSGPKYESSNLEDLVKNCGYPTGGGPTDPNYQAMKKKYAGPDSHDRDKIYRHFGNDFSLIVENTRNNIPVLPGQIFHRDFTYYESTLARITDEEAVSRADYSSRANQLVGFAYTQLFSGFDKTGPKPEVSIGMKELLRTAIGHVSSLSQEKLHEYAREGCDIHASLLDSQFAMRSAKLYYDFVCGTDTDVIVRTVESYDAEQAVRTVRAFVSIAEYERFKGRDHDKIKNYLKEKNVIGLDEQYKLGLRWLENAYEGKLANKEMGKKRFEVYGGYIEVEPCNWSKDNKARFDAMLNPRPCNWSQDRARRAQAQQSSRHKNPYQIH